MVSHIDSAAGRVSNAETKIIGAHDAELARKNCD